MPYYSFGMIPGATRTDIATPTQQSELQKMGYTLFFAKCGKDKNPIGFYEVGNRPLCNDQPSAAAPFKEMSPTAPPQPIRPPGQGGGPPPSTPPTTTPPTTTPPTTTPPTTTPPTTTPPTTTPPTTTPPTTTPPTTTTCPPGHPDCKSQSGGIDPPTSRTPASPPPSSELETSLPPEPDPIDPTVTSDAPAPETTVPTVPSAGGQTGGQTAIPDPGALPGGGDSGSSEGAAGDGGTGSGSGTGGDTAGSGDTAGNQPAHTSAVVTGEAEDAAPTSMAIENSAYSSPLSTGPGLLAVIVFVLFGMLIGGALVLRFVRRPVGGAYKPQHLG
ncbi:hypothetical protein [Candidatus Mycosynbacter amalyticus]|uniref:hypothetical protein n=1 Tax=Candidatus Mycosynbacter amalyticus TaxID=2665156 RepID=UPI0021B283DD|nr:hypothetical protein [Candidatus Mycosynbacter amalyticus]